MDTEVLEEIDNSSSSEEEVIIRRKKVKKNKTIPRKDLPAKQNDLTPEEIEVEEIPVGSGYRELDMGNEKLKPRKSTKNFKICDGVESEDDKEIQKPKAYKKATKPTDKRLKGNKQRSPAQIKAWEKALATRQRNRDLRAKEKKALEDEKKKKLSKKVVKKAVKIKQKEIISDAILNEISDESSDSDSDIDIQKVKQYVKAKKQKRLSKKKKETEPEPEIEAPPPPTLQRQQFTFF